MSRSSLLRLGVTLVQVFYDASSTPVTASDLGRSYMYLQGHSVLHQQHSRSSLPIKQTRRSLMSDGEQKSIFRRSVSPKYDLKRVLECESQGDKEIMFILC